MEREAFIRAFWRDVALQDAVALKGYFLPDAVIRWHTSNERFSVNEYIRANCEYPGKWGGAVERLEVMGDLIVTAARVWTDSGGASFHAVSFFRMEGIYISELDEYWGDDGPAPEWRAALHIGKPIYAESMDS